MYNLLFNELKLNGIYKYSFVKNYNELSKIKKRIIDKYSDKIEWLEIERKGTSYFVRYEPKINNNISSDNKVYDIVANKNALILKLDIQNGQILKNINEYVHINDMIVSSDIKLFDETKNIISAKGNVYGEVWYKVNVKYPINYYEEINTGNSYQTFSINFLNKKILLKNNNYMYKKHDINPIIKNNILPISFNKEVIYEYKIIDSYDYQSKALEIGLNKIRDNLKSQEYIIDYYVLDTKENNNIYEINIFVSVYENIGIYKERVDQIENEGNS